MYIRGERGVDKNVETSAKDCLCNSSRPVIFSSNPNPPSQSPSNVGACLHLIRLQDSRNSSQTRKPMPVQLSNAYVPILVAKQTQGIFPSLNSLLPLGIPLPCSSSFVRVAVEMRLVLMTSCDDGFLVNENEQAFPNRNL